MAVRPGGATDAASRISRLIAYQEKRFQEVFRQAIKSIQNEFTLAQLADLLAQGKLEEALAGVERAARLLGSAYGDSLASSARSSAAFLNRALTVAIAFDVSNHRAVSMMQQNTLRLVQGFTAEQKRLVRRVMTEAIAEGMNPRNQARLFRETIGLTERQARAVQNYRKSLLAVGRNPELTGPALQRRLRDKRFDRTVVRALREGQTIPQERIDRMVNRYRQRYVNYRAETIARTEALRSVHQGNELMYQQAYENGDIKPSEVLRTWISTGDDRTRDSHAMLHGEQRAPDEGWEVGIGGMLMYPGDPSAPPEETIQCRCSLTTRLSSSGFR
jgi:hypothetical protein